MLYYMCDKSGRSPTWPQLEHAIKRNFGGMESEECNPFEEFEKLININRDPLNLEKKTEEVWLIDRGGAAP